MAMKNQKETRHGNLSSHDLLKLESEMIKQTALLLYLIFLDCFMITRSTMGTGKTKIYDEDYSHSLSFFLIPLCSVDFCYLMDRSVNTVKLLVMIRVTEVIWILRILVFKDK
jgi:hypothetical protein